MLINSNKTLLFILFFSLTLATSCRTFRNVEVERIEGAILAQKEPIACPPNIAKKAASYAYYYSTKGTEYSWGGRDSLNNARIDCSGLVLMCYKYALINKEYVLGFKDDTSYNIEEKHSTPIENVPDLSAGDLLFMGHIGKKGITHVGLFLSNDKDTITFIDAKQWVNKVKVRSVTKNKKGEYKDEAHDSELKGYAKMLVYKVLDEEEFNPLMQDEDKITLYSDTTFDKKLTETPIEIGYEAYKFALLYTKMPYTYERGGNTLLDLSLITEEEVKEGEEEEGEEEREEGVQKISDIGLVLNSYRYALINTPYALPFKTASIGDLCNKWCKYYSAKGYSKSKGFPNIDKINAGDLIFMGEEDSNYIDHIAIFKEVTTKDEISYIDCDKEIKEKVNDPGGKKDIRLIVRTIEDKDFKRIKGFGKLKLKKVKNNTAAY